MASYDKLDTCQCAEEHFCGKQLKHEDLLQYSNIFASEFNNSALHDRVLILKVMEGGHGVLPGETSQREMTEPQDSRISSEQEIEGEKDDTFSTTNEWLEEENTRSTLSQADERKNEIISTKKEEPDQEHRLFIHSSWLAVQSPYFRALYAKEITLRVSEEELIPHYTLIESMYRPLILDDQDPYAVLQVLILANKYDINSIFKKCKYVLMSVTMSLQLCESILEVVYEMVAADDLIEHLQNVLINIFGPLDNTWHTDKFKNLSEISLRTLLSNSKLTVLSENTVFVALMYWCERNDYDGPSLLPLLRPQLMTAEFLHDVVFDHNLAKQMDGYDKVLLSGFRYHSSSPKRRKVLENEIARRAEYKVDCNEPSFTWHFCIPENSQQQNSEMYKSEHFWRCGYEMMLSLTFESNYCNIYLYVLNIEDASCLNFVWEVEAELLPGQQVRRATTFCDRFDMGCDRMEYFLLSQPIQRNCTHPINVYIRFVESSSPHPVACN